MKKHIPNFLTCCNLLCGCIGVIVALYARNVYILTLTSWLIFAACIFDFFDGFIARLLNVSSPIGKELDSLADMITFGLLPGIIIFKLLLFQIDPYCFELIKLLVTLKGGIIDYNAEMYMEAHPLLKFSPYIFIIALLIPIFSALRLAKFNIDTRQSDKFIGVPTPANAILIASFPLILAQNRFPMVTSLLSNVYVLMAVAVVMSLLLVAELPLLALKFKSFQWKDNKIRFSFLFVSVLLLVLLNWTAIPLIIIIYIITSIAENLYLKPKK